ncbi:MAG: GTPase ObgE [Chloroflexi bacterium]|nr:GTPase ObgE [Chloroflexota bacterium]MBU1749356.1 GTPase ObgE [Chloroflexota bacterium]
MFYDRAKVFVKAGSGGNGLVSFRREKYVPRGGPDGGNGGQGGSVYIEVAEDQDTLVRFKRRVHFSAPNGGHGGSNDRHGADGQDLVLSVPPGTLVRDAETEDLLADLERLGQRVQVARGGRGGRGNASFATSTRQAPHLAERGEPGQERWLILDLKIIADVGIIGYPNAGKSTLLAAVSRARPKIAAYPFTTLTPNLGVVTVGETGFVLADIPGLIEGASQGAGLGLDFLRHVERTRVLIHLLDGLSEDPVNEWLTINHELAEYSPALAEKPQITALNKMDLPDVQARWEQVREQLTQQAGPVYPISAATRQGVTDLLWAVVRQLEQTATQPAPSAPSAASAASEVRVYRHTPPPDEFTVTREESGYRVRGETVERLVFMTHLNQDEAILRLHQQLARLGVLAALETAGVQEGDMVYIGDAALEWIVEATS